MVDDELLSIPPPYGRRRVIIYTASLWSTTSYYLYRLPMVDDELLSMPPPYGRRRVIIYTASLWSTTSYYLYRLPMVDDELLSIPPPYGRRRVIIYTASLWSNEYGVRLLACYKVWVCGRSWRVLHPARKLVRFYILKCPSMPNSKFGSTTKM